ncbi:hypothetical protein [Kitasatospora sp. NPDC097643]|uniref:hypothetical protein n=1 Tax=Kitasatospora sp. NPDC097643 TaxID=3157230 RepID=UPI00332FA5D9
MAREKRFKDREITGNVDLSRVKLDWPVVIENCTFQDNIDLTEASIPELSLRRCTFHKLTARHLEVSRGDLNLEGSAGTIDISGAHIRDDVHLASAHPAGNPVALRANGIHVGGDFDCKSPQEDRFTCKGTLSLYEAEILGSLNLQYARLEARSKPRAFYGTQIKVGGEFEAKHLISSGPIYMLGAQIIGELDLSGARISTPKLDALHPTGIVLDRSHIGGSLFCGDGFTCIGGLKGIGLTVDGSAYFYGATLTSNEKEKQGKALELERSHIRGTLRLRYWKKPRQFHMGEESRDLRRGNSEYLTFACDGVISLSQTTVDCQVHIETGDIRGRRFPTGECDKSVPMAVDLSQLRTELLILYGGPGRGGDPPREGSRIDLTGATLGKLLDYLIDEEDEEDVYPTILKGCTYGLIHQTADKGVRLEWLKKGSALSRNLNPDLNVSYRNEGPFGQPYQQVAEASARVGNDALSRAVLWQMHEAVNDTHVRGMGGDGGGLPSRILKRTWSWFQDITIGYGYRPGLAAFWLLFFWAVGVVTFWHWPPVLASSMAKPREMSGVEHLTYPLDLMIPLHAFGQQSQWHPVGLFPQTVAVVLTVLGWIFGITIVAAITRVARRA